MTSQGARGQNVGVMYGGDLRYRRYLSEMWLNGGGWFRLASVAALTVAACLTEGPIVLAWLAGAIALVLGPGYLIWRPRARKGKPYYWRKR